MPLEDRRVFLGLPYYDSFLEYPFREGRLGGPSTNYQMIHKAYERAHHFLRVLQSNDVDITNEYRRLHSLIWKRGNETKWRGARGKHAVVLCFFPFSLQCSPKLCIFILPDLCNAMIIVNADRTKYVLCSIGRVLLVRLVLLTAGKLLGNSHELWMHFLKRHYSGLPPVMINLTVFWSHRSRLDSRIHRNRVQYLCLHDLCRNARLYFNL